MQVQDTAIVIDGVLDGACALCVLLCMYFEVTVMHVRLWYPCYCNDRTCSFHPDSVMTQALIVKMQ